jgi:uncharacterized protein (DUF2225 family)/CRP-like cAMP-binding protein
MAVSALGVYPAATAPALRRRVDPTGRPGSLARRVLALTAGAVLCREDDPPGAAYLILSGSVRVYRRDRKNPQDIEQIAELGPGAVVGELAPLLNLPRSATVQAITRAEVLEMPSPQLRVMAQAHTSLLRVLTLALQERAGLSAAEITALAARQGVDLSTVGAFLEDADASPRQELPAPPHDQALVYPKPVTCPACGTTFSALVFRTHKEQPAERETDFHQRYRTLATPYDYDVWVCPNDLYAAFPSDFADLSAGQRDRVADAVNEVVATQWAGQRPDFNVDRNLALRERSLHLALAIYRLRDASPLRLAGVLHRLAWCAREQGEEGGERRWLQDALEAYQAGYGTADSEDPKDDLRVQYLCGELARRLGDPATALKWFGQVLGHPAIKQYPMWERAARDQWALVRETAAMPPNTPVGLMAAAHR